MRWSSSLISPTDWNKANISKLNMDWCNGKVANSTRWNMPSISVMVRAEKSIVGGAVRFASVKLSEVFSRASHVLTIDDKIVCFVFSFGDSITITYAEQHRWGDWKIDQLFTHVVDSTWYLHIDLLTEIGYHESECVCALTFRGKQKDCVLIF